MYIQTKHCKKAQPSLFRRPERRRGCLLMRKSPGIEEDSIEQLETRRRTGLFMRSALFTIGRVFGGHCSIGTCRISTMTILCCKAWDGTRSAAPDTSTGFSEQLSWSSAPLVFLRLESRLRLVKLISLLPFPFGFCCSSCPLQSSR
jgi:hypothetical protein